MADIAPKFKEETGVTVKVDILSYPELLTKVTADFIGHTKGYDLADDGQSSGRASSPRPATPST